MSEAIINGVARAVLKEGEYGNIALYDEDDRLLGVVTDKAALGLRDVELESE